MAEGGAHGRKIQTLGGNLGRPPHRPPDGLNDPFTNGVRLGLRGGLFSTSSPSRCMQLIQLGREDGQMLIIQGNNITNRQ
jgi:hypothetical protein